MMPKLSVSVPDDLWSQACAEKPDWGASQLVQEALRRYVGGVRGNPPFVRQRSEQSKALLEEALERVASRTQVTYEEGYQAALRFAEEAPWKLVDEIGALGCSVDLWWETNQWDQDYEPSQEEQFFHDSVKNVMTAQYEHDATFRVGFADGIKDLWSTLIGEPHLFGRREATDSDELPFE